MAADEVGRRERKKMQTHQLLRTAALRLAAERGLQKVTVEDIAEGADVSVRTFYAHFPSKEDAIIGFDASRVAQLREALLSRPTDEEPLASLHVVMQELLDESSEEWPLRMCVLKADSSLLPRMFSSFAVFERAMVEVLAERLHTDPVNDPYPALVAAVATGTVRASIGAWRHVDERRELADILSAAFTRVGQGLRTSDAPSAQVATRSAQPSVKAKAKVR